MKLQQRDFDEIERKMRRRSNKWQALLIIGGMIVIAAIISYSLPTWVLDAALAHRSLAFSWQGWLLLGPTLAYLIIVVNLWEKAEEATLDFWWNILYSARLEVDKNEKSV